MHPTLEILPKLLAAGAAGSAAVAAALQSGVLPDAPEAASPLAWAFMVVVLLALGGASWVVRFVLRVGVDQFAKMVSAVEGLTAAVKDLDGEVKAVSRAVTVKRSPELRTRAGD